MITDHSTEFRNACAKDFSFVQHRYLFVLALIVMVSDHRSGLHIHVRADDGITYKIEMGKRCSLKNEAGFYLTAWPDLYTFVKKNSTAQICMGADKTICTDDRRSFQHNMLFD